MVDPRAGNGASNCTADNINLLDQAVTRLPGPLRHRLPVRLDGVGFSHDLLDHIAAGGGRRGRRWEFSVGWSCIDIEMDAIARLIAIGLITVRAVATHTIELIVVPGQR